MNSAIGYLWKSSFDYHVKDQKCAEGNASLRRLPIVFIFTKLGVQARCTTNYLYALRLLQQITIVS
jgi:hypothetical protein